MIWHQQQINPFCNLNGSILGYFIFIYEYVLFKALEYKYAFSSRDEFNHPLILTKQIICWEIPIREKYDNVEDYYSYFAKVSYTEEFNEIGYEIINLQSQEGDTNKGKLVVISLKALLDKTFDCEFVTPPPPRKTNSKAKAGSKKSK